ncbi:MAG: acetyl/propionyl/methylcrotonyl-CoA carboxylase subunit alpha [Candidatus Melainabacteria bacterium]
MFNKILIANRGEIACRIIQTVQEMGLVAVAVYNDHDETARHVRLADEAYALPGTSLSETYLNAKAILSLCKEHQVDAIHPGYGFLSENAGFARACAKAGVAFIGPSPDVISAMGDKIAARNLMHQAGVPIVPGWHGAADAPLATIQREAEHMGYPVLIKATAGGGGKGMRRVDTPEALKDAWEAASREAQKAFGNAQVFLEKYIIKPRHIEFQILADNDGNTVHLFERECSIQRRYQKIIEESPAPNLSAELREKMGEAAVQAARAMGYTNAGTVEFIVGADGGFYFLEVNTRLQVEHPITELVTQQDLVRLQIQIAAGHRLPFTQTELTQSGHAIECRLYAEDPAQNFMPATGTLHQWLPPTGSGIRLDTGYQSGDAVTVHFDPMLAKLIVWGSDRDSALRKMQWALRQFVVLGVTQNLDFLHRVLSHPAFQEGLTHTHFIPEHGLDQPAEATGETEESILVEALLQWAAEQPANGAQSVTAPTAADPATGQISSPLSPWLAAGGWRGTPLSEGGRHA